MSNQLDRGHTMSEHFLIRKQVLQKFLLIVLLINLHANTHQQLFNDLKTTSNDASLGVSGLALLSNYLDPMWPGHTCMCVPVACCFTCDKM